MKLHELKNVDGSVTTKTRRGRGIGSGLGKTSGRGHKGQNSRSGGGKAPGFEGGQTPLYRRLPKFGFKNINRKTYAYINVDQLNVFDDGTIISSALLIEEGFIKKEHDGLKILGNGELTKKLTVQANKFSKKAKEAIENAGGTVEVI